MAEKFEDVLKKLGKTVKKPSAGKAQEVLAVQLVDDKGKVIKDDTGAAATEEKRDAAVWKTKQLTLLESILEALGGKKKGGKDKEKEGSSLGKGLMASMAGGMAGAGVGGILGTMMAGLGIGAIVGAGILAAFHSFKDGLAAMDWAKEMGMEAETGFIAGFLGGDKKGGWMNAAFQGLKGMAMGATAGMAFGPVGIVVGALIGGALFGIAGFFGAEKIAELIDPIVVKVKTFLGMSITLTEKEKKAAETLAKEVTAKAKTLREEWQASIKQLELAMETGADKKTIDALTLKEAKARQLFLETKIRAKKLVEITLENERVAEKNALNAAEAAVSRNAREVRNLQNQERKLKSAITRHGEDTEEGQLAAAKLTQIRVKLREKVEEGKKLRQDEVDAEEALLKEDRKIAELAKEAGVKAPWRTRLNLQWQTMKDNWNLLSDIIPMIWKNYVFDPGSGATMGGAGTPMKIFGIDFGEVFRKVKGKLQTTFNNVSQAIKGFFKSYIFDPGAAATMGGGGTPMRIFGVDFVGVFNEIKGVLQTKWNNIKQAVPIWFKNHIFDSGGAGVPMRIFGFDMVMPKFAMESWDKLRTIIPKWFKNYIFDPGSGATMGGAGTPMRIFGMEIKFPNFDFELPSLEDFTMPDFNLKENWDKFTSSIPQWIKNNIFDPGSSDPGGLGQGTPMKIFGMEIKFPSLNISFSGMADKIMALLPRWLTDPVGYIKDMVKWFPKLGKTDAEKAAVKTAEMKKATEVLEKVENKKLKDFTIDDLKEMLRLATPALGDATKAQQAEMDVIYRELERRAKPKQMGGPVKKGMPYLVGEGTTQGELFIPNSSGMILSAQRTEQILQAGLQRGAAAGAGGGGTTLVNAPVTSVNNSQSHMTNTTISFSHPSAILNTVNAAA